MYGVTFFFPGKAHLIFKTELVQFQLISSTFLFLLLKLEEKQRQDARVRKETNTKWVTRVILVFFITLLLNISFARGKIFFRVLAKDREILDRQYLTYFTGIHV